MKTTIMSFLSLPLIAMSLCCCSNDPSTEPPSQPEEPETPATPWVLAWEDEFDATEINEAVWSRIPQGTPDWAKYQSSDNRCYEKRASSIVLKGIVNNDKATDSRDYLCGGLWTLGKKSFSPGRIEVRARMTAATGAWPAIWMMPFKSTQGWPYDGEIDIMERLNSDRFVYQTLHSGYIDVEGNRNNPQYSCRPTVADPSQYHIYGVEFTADALTFYVDGEQTMKYPNIGVDGQFPYFKEWDLRIDMQLGGSWVGAIRPTTLPVEMEVDWVRYYVAR